MSKSFGNYLSKKLGRLIQLIQKLVVDKHSFTDKDEMLSLDTMSFIDCYIISIATKPLHAYQLWSELCY